MRYRTRIVIALVAVLATAAAVLWGRLGSRELTTGAAGPAPGAVGRTSAQGAGGEILYYRNPMGLPDVSPVPKKDAMGMDYVPVYAGERPQQGQVRISTDKLQRLGVKTAAVTRRSLARTLRIVGTIQPDEQRESTISAKFEGWITELRVGTTGAHVTKGQPLLEAYSPELVSAQQDYRIAVEALEALRGADPDTRTSAAALVRSNLERLKNWDIAEADLEALRGGASPRRTLVLRAQRDGIVVDKPARVGMRFMPGEPLFQIADLSSVWLIGSVYEQDLALVHVGQRATASTVAYPGHAFTGTIAFVSPVLQSETRTVPVRVALANQAGLLKPGMYGYVDLAAGPAEPRLAVPDSAVLDTGTRQLVIVDRGGGVFESREIRAGIHGDGYTEVLAGVSEHESIVVDGNFLVDAESNLKAAVGTMSGHADGTAPTDAGPQARPPATPPAAGR